MQASWFPQLNLLESLRLGNPIQPHSLDSFINCPLPNLSATTEWLCPVGPSSSLAEAATLRVLLESQVYETFLVVQWLRLCVSNAGDMGSVPV